MYWSESREGSERWLRELEHLTYEGRLRAGVLQHREGSGGSYPCV